MVLFFIEKKRKVIASIMLSLIYVEIVVPAYALNATKGNVLPYTVSDCHNSTKADGPIGAGLTKASTISLSRIGKMVDGGPTQPESESFHSVNSNDMVDLFTGDFKYTIPLIDVGGYPLAIGYNSGINMDQEASWVGLGWNLNPGAITRNLRGLPDDFDGRDSIVKQMNIKENKTVGVSATLGTKVSGYPMSANFNMGLFYNNYRGWGMESGASVGLSAGAKGFGTLTGGLSISNNTHEGISVSPSISYETFRKENEEKGGFTGTLSVGLSYNTRSGLKALQYSAGIKQNTAIVKDKTVPGVDENGYEVSKLERSVSTASAERGTISSSISYVSPAFFPGISMPYTTEAYNGRFNVGIPVFGVYPHVGVSGYVTRQFIAKDDQYRELPAYGYLNMQNVDRNGVNLLDFGREREIPVKEDNKNIAVPYYTYDVFSISGEGTGGMFRARRGDVGYVSDHKLKTKSISMGGGLDLGFGQLFEFGVDFNRTIPETTTGPLLETGSIVSPFKKKTGLFEPSYFKNAGEMGAIDPEYLNSVGGTDLVFAELSYPQTSYMGPSGVLQVYKGGRVTNNIYAWDGYGIKNKRDKRTQVISYLTAEEAATVSADKFIENYPLNSFPVSDCEKSIPDGLESELGFTGDVYNGIDATKGGYLRTVDFPDVNFNNGSDLLNKNPPLKDYIWINTAKKNNSQYTIQWKARMRPPADGTYKCTFEFNDKVRYYINDVRVYNHWKNEGFGTDFFSINLEGNRYYDIMIEYCNDISDGYFRQKWVNQDGEQMKDMFFIPPKADTLVTSSGVSIEKRVNSFRKKNHISEIEVLNTSGQRYVYGLPVYNLVEREYTFSLNHSDTAAKYGEADYVHGKDNTPDNLNGNDNYFNMQETPAYAHSFLLTSIQSPDYVDVTGNGITDDDLGTAVKFNYSKTAGASYRFKWRTPGNKKTTYNEGLKSDTRDDKGSYVYGEKELWYLNSIISNTMIATFTVGNREDLLSITEKGDLASEGPAKFLKEINLYTKAEYGKAIDESRQPIPVKTVHFDYDYSLCKGVNGDPTKGKLTLKGIWFSYNGNQSKNIARAKQNGYVFYYNSKNPGYEHTSFDRWGNYKNPLDNPQSTPTDLITNAEFPYAIQDSAVMAKNAAAWTLDSIKLPSGGRMKINFESDDYGFVQNKRATSMVQIAGLSQSAPQYVTDLTRSLYTNSGPSFSDNLYVSFKVDKPVANKAAVLKKYLKDLNDTIFFRLNVQMPSDLNGKGNENIPCYGYLDSTDYGTFDHGNYIYFKLRPVHLDGDEGSRFSPLANAAIQFMKANLPSKAYPGSEVGSGLTGEAAIKMILQLSTNVVSEFAGVDRSSRVRGSARDLDLKRSFARLCSPEYKKYGGGLRVRNILIYDNWNAMTNQKESLYGTEYKYTMLNEDSLEISSGVASYEPLLGGEENPWKKPIVYKEKVGKMIPEVTSYVETPFGESLFPGASVGYRKVVARSIHRGDKIRSGMGYTVNGFYTAYEFPTISSYVELNDSTRMRYKPSNLNNWLKLDAKYQLMISQGFLVELNDMHGKPRNTETFAEGSDKPISTSTVYYHVDNPSMAIQHLNNTVTTLNANGDINDKAQCGIDIELMEDARQQVSRTSSLTIAGGSIGVMLGLPSTWPFMFPLPQHEESIFRSIAITKLVNRRGIVDSMVVTDRGSRVVTKNLMYDEETGNVLLTETQNEFDDPIYTFSLPNYWVYDRMGLAYKNIGVGTSMNVSKGIADVGADDIVKRYTTGDEVMFEYYKKIGVESFDTCYSVFAQFPNIGKGYVLELSEIKGGPKKVMVVTADGQPVDDARNFKTLRSGRKNVLGTAGMVTMKKNPLATDEWGTLLILDDSRDILSATSVEYSENWKISDIQKAILRCVLK
ncbi:PA14 domain-containing protein [Chitinophaga sp. sic0106]|uniref:PA14 domain-containing protein n=1 Tax=Chitinophaga sp. sic0106 TaxID=2854785 RepID=UPI001C4784B6|nr:PA14 domain-containing protein [Chitinophaga sp. sic0106]MBV7533916.1 hypothetical protein [Chitinophaga sp. sic0106]